MKKGGKKAKGNNWPTTQSYTRRLINIETRLQVTYIYSRTRLNSIQGKNVSQKRESITDRIGSHRKKMTKERARVTGKNEEKEIE